MPSKVLFSIDDIQLAECVRKSPCSCDLKYADYKDQQMRDDLWKCISNILKKNGLIIQYINISKLFFCVLNTVELYIFGTYKI